MFNAVFTANGGPTGIRFLAKAVSISFPISQGLSWWFCRVGFLVAVLEISGLQQNKRRSTAIGTVAVQCVLFWRL
ncbi:hypothetical protein, partial [Propionivibrio sp.]|uniref:hypothetical protein n=1 Tax=Propionivibrio sp. TaxID=2212460 RepID=UPI0025D1D1D8